MKKIILIAVLLISIISIGQKNNFYGSSGKEYYKLKVDKATYDLLKIEDGTIFFNMGIQGDCFYNSGILTIKNLFYPSKDELRFQNDYEKQDELNYALNKQIGLDIKISLSVHKMRSMFKHSIGNSKEFLKELLPNDIVFREASNFVWFTSGFILYFDSNGGYTDIDFKKI